jgi:hypothetical protein
MIVNGKSFDGATHFMDTYDTLQADVGNALWSNEYCPVQLYGNRQIRLLLLTLFRQHICCHISGSFAAYTARVLKSYRAAVLYVALKDHPLLNIIFQKGPVVGNFYLNDFLFELLESQPQSDTHLLRFNERLQYHSNCLRN